MKTLTVEEVPDQETGPLRHFCETLGASERLLIDVAPPTWATFNTCYPNAVRACELVGGTPLTGWKVWFWPKVWYHAVHHCVWRTGDGATIDVTPQENGATKTYFVRCDDVTFDPLGLSLRQDRYKILWQHPKVEELVQVIGKRDKLIGTKRERRGGVLVPTFHQDELDQIMNRATPLWQWVERNYRRR